MKFDEYLKESLEKDPELKREYEILTGKIMTCRKGDFYILNYGIKNDERILKKVNGYIINEKVGFARNDRGEFYPYELKTGWDLGTIAWYRLIMSGYNGVFNLLNAYKAFVHCDGYEKIDNILSSQFKEIQTRMTIIKKAYEADKE